jgi:hypothetical protein
MSTTEAEYRSLAEGAKEAVYLKRLLQELDLPTINQVKVECSHAQVYSTLQEARAPTELDIHLNCDNISAIQLARNPVFHARSKHIELHYHFIREQIIQGEVAVNYINTQEQPADILMKALPQEPFENTGSQLEYAHSAQSWHQSDFTIQAIVTTLYLLISCLIIIVSNEQLCQGPIRKSSVDTSTTAQTSLSIATHIGPLVLDISSARLF